MKLTDKQIERYRELYRARFGTAISKEEASEQGMELIALLKTIIKNN